MGETKKKKKPQFVGFPPLRPPQRAKLEKEFTLDCIAVGNLSDTSKNKTNPCVQVTVPLYNPQMDRGCKNYFGFKGIKKLLERTEESRPGTTQYGRVYDTLIRNSHANTYLTLRNKHGAGNDVETVAGHYSSPYFQNAKPVT